MKQNQKTATKDEFYLHHSMEAEQVVLCSAIIKPSIIPLLRSKASASDFYIRSHRIIFGRMLQAYDEIGEGLDVTTLEPYFTRQEMDDMGGN